MKSIILFVILSLYFGSSAIFARDNTMSKDAIEVIGIADEFIKKSNINIAEYKLVQIKNLVISGADYKGNNFWKITYKARSTIDKGKGGEIYIEVNLQEKSARLLGYGE